MLYEAVLFDECMEEVNADVTDRLKKIPRMLNFRRLSRIESVIEIII